MKLYVSTEQMSRRAKSNKNPISILLLERGQIIPSALISIHFAPVSEIPWLDWKLFKKRAF